MRLPLTQTGLVASVVFSLILVVQKPTKTRIKIIGRLPNSVDCPTRTNECRYRRRQIGAGGDSGRDGSAHSGIDVFREHWSAQGQITSGESRLMLSADYAILLTSARAVWRTEASPI